MGNIGCHETSVTINQPCITNYGVVKDEWTVLPLNMGRIGWPETSV